ncbi:MAG: antitoxin [Chloroflexota bacterium]|nr:antitoxin [Chloroflexota bacterium]MDE2941706.1 antitoxin [Chloroflexota bacterium]MDE3267156.1 antitoxin [Chloroflexota bacterium]
MTKRLQVLLDEEEITEIQDVAREQRLTVAEWVRQSLRAARHERPGATDVKLRAIAEAYRHSFPTGDIDSLLDEIEAGRQLQ